ncbi:MAG: hypothetical protein P8L44_02315 [Opitutales bacterium]|nr:hypothetical protein [Opitutales bacterium]
MNLSDEDLEKELASLRPTAPSELLKSNIEEELEEQQKPARIKLSSYGRSWQSRRQPAWL